MSNALEVGLLKCYDHFKGFGFIQREKGKDVFVHYQSFVDKDSAIVVGAQLQFRVEKTPKGLKALDVKKLS
ncbi:MAG: retron Se72 family effector protein [Pedobacter sp.]|nr:retron Se72 family effector protein [Pedobacter sp.]